MVAMACAWGFAATSANALEPVEQAPLEPLRLPEVGEVLDRVPEDLSARLRVEVIGATEPGVARLKRLIDFLATPTGLGLQYRDDATLSVAEVYRTREANCLSFTLLFITLAREAGMTAYAQQPSAPPVSRLEGDTLVRLGHINAVVVIGGRHYLVDVTGDYDEHAKFERVSDAQMMAAFYNNVAVQRMLENKLDLADAVMLEALRLDPRFASGWNSAGVIRARRGDLAGAEQAYLSALSAEPGHSEALINLIGLYDRQGRTAQADRYRERLLRIKRKDPYHQYLLGLGAARAGDDWAAVSYFRRATRLFKDDARFYTALAEAYRRLGYVKQAEVAERRGREVVGRMGRRGWGLRSDEPLESGHPSKSGQP